MKLVAPENLPLLEVLTLISPDSSNTTLRSWLKEGRVSVDETIQKVSSYPVRKGQLVSVGRKDKVIEGDIKIIYEDQHLVVVEKPYGILSVATDFDSENTVHTFVKQKYKRNKVYVVHRLDQETSGVMLFALTEQAYKGLKETFYHHDLERSYTAIVEGLMKEKQGKWESYLYEDESFTVRTTNDSEKGRLSITHFKVESAAKQYTRLILTLETGRKNQIRVHCKEAGHPVVGDKKYGAESNPIKRLCLHASLLAFTHPVTGKPMRFDSPPPKLFDRIVPRRLQPVKAPPQKNNPHLKA
jgi:23S rRNA pseudouridine1911/1915/1917 synthase